MKFGAIILFSLAATLSVVSAAPLAKQAPSIVPGAFFDRFFVIVLENKDYTQVAANSYFRSLAKKGTLLTNYHGTTHPSQPNYIAMMSGDVHGFFHDKLHSYRVKNLVDLLEPKGISWKSYQENYPGHCYRKEDAFKELYVRKHNPFMSFVNVRTNPARCARIVHARELETDLANNDLPQFSFYTPNMKNDGHDTKVPFVAKWLKGFIEPKLNNPNFMDKTAILITFDEDDSEERKNKNRVYTILLGGAVRSPPGTKDNTPYNHYSVLATLEKNWDLGDLGKKDTEATPFQNLGDLDNNDVEDTPFEEFG
ncbi:hypothetical protein DFQ27_008692 [Actinomortierella ambigua]|uniref:Acid phosphatase n=1 Tax=Actinomortierella ambigua TaxID=1343610 RepID=A0A9P6PPZ5_9FUNG|nr:hypothetical protein DFQ27_008692 [Actinomortierella ambigua]